MARYRATVSRPASQGFPYAPSLAIVELFVCVPLRDLLVAPAQDLANMGKAPTAIGES